MPVYLISPVTNVLRVAVHVAKFRQELWVDDTEREREGTAVGCIENDSMDV